MYIHGMYRFYIPVQVQTCLYMVQTCQCLYCFAKSCPGGQDSRCIELEETLISKLFGSFDIEVLNFYIEVLDFNIELEVLH